jgi:hypothetical protein
MDEIEAYIRQLFQEASTPLEKMYDFWTDEDWRDGAPLTRHKIWSAETGLPIACHLCGRDDQWTAGGHSKAPVFVCVHEPIDIGRGSIPQEARVPPGDVYKYEKL